LPASFRSFSGSHGGADGSVTACLAPSPTPSHPVWRPPWAARLSGLTAASPAAMAKVGFGDRAEEFDETDGPLSSNGQRPELVRHGPGTCEQVADACKFGELDDSAVVGVGLPVAWNARHLECAAALDADISYPQGLRGSPSGLDRCRLPRAFSHQ
jgi:hypothetical protein